MNQTDTNICEKIDIKPFAYAVSLFKLFSHLRFLLKIVSIFVIYHHGRESE